MTYTEVGVSLESFRCFPAPGRTRIDSAIEVAKQMETACFVPPDRVFIGHDGRVEMEWYGAELPDGDAHYAYLGIDADEAEIDVWPVKGEQTKLRVPIADAAARFVEINMRGTT